MATTSASSPVPGGDHANVAGAVSSASSSFLAPAPPLSPLVLVKGMSFPDGQAAIYFVQDYALHHNKQVRVGCRGGKHRKLVCTSDGCPFFVQVYQRHSKSDKTWYLSSFDASHAATCTSSAKPTKRQLVAMASFKNAISQTPEASAASLASFIEDQSRVPLRMNLRTVYRAKEALRSALVDKQSQSFRRVTSLLSQFQSLNAGSYAKHDVDDGGRFLRAFVACGVFTQAMAQHPQVFGFECVPAVGMFPGFHMYLLGKDSNRKTVIVAAAAVASLRGVTEDHLQWFFRSVHAAGVSIQLAPILAIVTTQLLAVEAELGLTFRICTRYLIERELAKIPTFNQHHQTLVWGLQASETAQEYNNRLHWIATACGQEVAALLRQVSYERWVLAGSMDQKPLYGWRSRDFSEGRAGDASDAVAPFIQQQQHKLPFDFLDALMEKWAQDAFERSSAYEKWAQAGLKVTPGAQELYDQEVKHIGEFVVTRSSPSVAFVSQVTSNAGSTSAPTATRCRVDLASNTCTCTFMQQHGIPCRHVIAVVLFCGHMDSITARFAAMYRLENVRAAYHGKGVELPLQASLTENDDCLPPGMVVKVPRGPKPKPRPAPTSEPTNVGDATNDGGDAAEPSEHQAETAAVSPEDAAQPPSSASTTRKPSKKRSQADTGATPEAEASTSGTAPVPKPKRCSRCKSTGHNVRSCPMAAHAAVAAAAGAALME